MLKKDKSKLLPINSSTILGFVNANTIECGLDEAGRGCLAGPVVAAAVILPKDFYLPQLNDSKKLTAKQRESISASIKQIALDYSIAVVSNTVIDQINILEATMMAMHEAVNKLSVKPELLLIDGPLFKPYPNLDYRCIIKGDSKIASIAAASVLAKHHRDELMIAYHQKFPDFGFDKHKGYASKMHLEHILKSGICNIHRKSFLKKLNQLKLF